MLNPLYQQIICYAFCAIRCAEKEVICCSAIILIRITPKISNWTIENVNLS